jgi:uncharacterized protein (DUF58 family)
MQANHEPPKLGHGAGTRGPGLLSKILAVITGAALLVGAVAVSIVLFAVTLTVLLGIGIYLWWKTRDLRKQMRQPPPEGDVIEGEAVRVVRPESREKR